MRNRIFSQFYKPLTSPWSKQKSKTRSISRSNRGQIEVKSKKLEKGEITFLGIFNIVIKEMDFKMNQKL